MKVENREIQLDNITPQIATQIDILIRYWNLVDEELSLTLKDKDPIKIYINSKGGDLDSAITIVNAIKMSRTPVYTYNIGTTYQESFLIYLAGHKRFAYQNAIFMYLVKDFNIQENESNFYTIDALKEKRQKDIKDFIIEKISITEAQYEKHKKAEWWFSAEEAQKIRICNELVRNHFQE